MNLKKITLCGDESVCGNKHFAYCVKNAAGKCALKIPLNNLVTEESNETMYSRLTEELMDNKTIFNFMLFNNMYVDFDAENYIQIQDEVILPYSKMNSKYFKSLIPKKDAAYVNSNNFVTTTGKIKDMGLNLEEQFLK